METKVFEIRDRGTFMPCMAIRLNCADEKNIEARFLLRRAGYAPIENYFLFHPLCSNKINYDVHNWNNEGRTIALAHQYVTDHWDDLKNGEVIDVEFILGETTEKKISERNDHEH